MLNILQKASDITLKLSLGERKLFEFLASQVDKTKNKQENCEKSIIFLNHH